MPVMTPYHDLETFAPAKLTVELVPSTSWYSNVRSEVSKKDWNAIRKRVYREANYVCQICAGRGSKWPVECHEIWAYDDENHIQELAGMQALCPKCLQCNQPNQRHYHYCLKL